jgi:hypothetical protein
MRRKLIAGISAIGASAALFRLGAAVVSGVTWQLGEWDNLGTVTSLWEGLRGLPACWRDSRDMDEFLDLQERNIVNLGLLLLPVIAVGLAIYRLGTRRKRADELCDYRDETRGAALDGRMGQEKERRP